MKRAAILIAALAAACSSTQTANIELFEASPATVQAGGTTTLFFSAPNAVTLSIDNGVGDVTGRTHVDVSPAQTTTYALSAKSKDGVTSSQQVTINVVASRASAYKVEAPASARAGDTVSIAITALGPDGQRLTTFLGTATLTTDEAGSTLPHLAAFTAAGQGKVTVQAVFHAAGTHGIVASDAQARGAVDLPVKNGVATALALSGVPSSVRAGDALSLRVAAMDAFGNVAQDFTGAVALAASDAAAQVPASVAFGAEDLGVRTVPVSFATSGPAALTATSGALKAAASAAVANAPAASFALLNAPSDATAGDTVTVSLVARDRFGNTAIDYVGTVHVAASDGAATDVTFAASDAGVKAVSLPVATEGAQQISANGGAVSGSCNVRVHHAPASAYRLSSLPASTVAGTPLSLVVTALDAKGNVVTDYAGVAHFSTGEASDQLPADGGFTSGVRTVSLALLKAGSRAVTVSEAGGTLSASTAPVTVGPAAAQRLAGNSGVTVTAGVANTYTVTAYDLYGNVAAYAGTLHVTSDDAGATLPADQTAAAGVASFSATLAKAGARKLTVTDAANAALTVTMWPKVTPAGAARYALGAVPAQLTAGAAVTLSATAFDAFGNVATGYAAAAHFTSTEATDAVPADTAFVAGVVTASLPLKKAGSRTLSVSEAGGTLTATTTAINVVPAAAASFALSGPATSTAGTVATVALSAFDAYGNAATGYAGTIHVTSSDAQAVLPADGAAAAGTDALSVTLKTAGAQTVTASDGSIQASATVQVAAAGANAIAISGVPSSVTAGAPTTAVVSATDSFGNVAPTFAGTVSFATGDSQATLPQTYTFSPSDAGSHAFSFKLATAGNWTLTATAGALTATSGAIAVAAAAGDHVRIGGLPSSAHAGDALTASLTVLDRYGNTAAFNGKLHLVLTDSAGSVADASISSGTGTAQPHFATVGLQSLVVSDAVLTGSFELSITPAQAVSYQLAALPAVAVAGQPLTLTATALDAFGNVDTSYAATAHVAGQSGDQLPADTAFSAGRLSVGVAFTSSGSHQVTLSQVAGSITANSTRVTVNSDVPKALVVTPSGGAVAGTPASFTVTVADRFGNTVPTYAGIVDFTSTDAAFVSPGATQFTAGTGTRSFTATFKTAGAERLDAHDVASPSLAGGAAWTVSPGAATACVVDQAPSTISSGTPLGFRVTLNDGFGNKATNYAGTVVLSSTDTAAQFPRASATYQPAVDAGAHVFTVRLLTTGLQTITATDSANAGITCSYRTGVYAPTVHYSVTFGADANVGAPATATITVLNPVNAVIPDYAGTVTFASSDAAAVLPANYAFNGTQGGVATVTVTFNTTGTQSLVASELNNPGVTGAASVPVHGLVYTNPTPGNSVRLVQNAAASGPGLVQLDLIVDKTVRSAYGAGMNLPADQTRVLADATPLVEGTALNTGSAPKAVAATQASSVLYSVVSQKNAGTGAVTSDVQLTAGAVLYSVRLKLNPTAQVGVVFDGSQPMPGFRAAVRDRLGNDTVGQSDFGIGRLEVK